MNPNDNLTARSDGEPATPPARARKKRTGKIIEKTRALCSRYVTRQRVWALTKWLAVKSGGLATLVGLLALWDSYRPKILITPGPSIAPKLAFGTMFIIQNVGLLPIREVVYETTFYEHNLRPSATSTTKVTISKNVSVIPELLPLESHSLRCGTLDFQPEFTPVCQFSVTYKPKYFGERTDQLCFWAVKDTDGNWQWFPSGHQNFWKMKTRKVEIPATNPVTIFLPGHD